MNEKERLLLSIGVLPPGATRKRFDRQMVKVTPKNGKTYETYLLSQTEDSEGEVIVYYVSGIEALFADEVTIELL